MSSEGDSLLQKLERDFVNNVRVENRTFRLRTYKDCFVGREAVDYLVKSGHAQNRADAVALGKSLQLDLHLFEHVSRDQDFSDEYLFYRFLAPNERGGRTIDEATGDAVRWTNFLDPSTTRVGESMALQPEFPLRKRLPDDDMHAMSQIWPLDELNTELLDNVHPPLWKDPQRTDYDMVVIGAGPGGLVTAAGAAGVGARVALIEANFLGGDCLNFGCVPSKSLMHSANLAHSMRDQNSLSSAGISISGEVHVDFPRVMERVRRIRAHISHHDSAERFSQEMGVEVFIGFGQFASERSVTVNNKTLTFKRAVVATGGYPCLLSMPGLKELHQKATAPPEPSSDGTAKPRPLVMTNETFFNMTERPKKLAVIGTGAVGMELGQAMQRLGCSVTIICRSEIVLTKEDEDMSALVKNQMIKDGVEFRLSVKEFKQLNLTGKMSDSGYPEMEMTIVERGSSGEAKMLFDAVLVACGRCPNVRGLNLEAAKVEYDLEKGLVVNDRLQTTNPRVFGVGDVCSEFKFTHASDFMARAVIRNALFFGKERMSRMLIPYCTFTSPEIASVGLYGKDLDKRGMKYRVIEKHFKDNDRAICNDDVEGFVRVRVDAASDKILGASIVGTGADNMISELTLAMQSDTGLGSLAGVIHPYPTTAEAIRQSGDLYNKTRLTTMVKSMLRNIVKLQR